MSTYVFGGCVESSPEIKWEFKSSRRPPNSLREMKKGGVIDMIEREI